MEEKRYAAAEFTKALKKKELSEVIPLKMEGFVKPDDKDETIIQFAPFRCGVWVPVKLEQIEHVVDLGARTCEDHSHRFARLQFKESSTAEASLLRAMLAVSALDSAHNTPADQPIRAHHGGANCAVACSICRRFPWKTGPCSVCESTACQGQGNEWNLDSRESAHSGRAAYAPAPAYRPTGGCYSTCLYYTHDPVHCRNYCYPPFDG